MTKWNKVEVALNCKPIYFWRLYLPQVFSFYIFHNLELGTGHNNPHSIDDLKIDETNHFFDFHYVLWVKDHKNNSTNEVTSLYHCSSYLVLLQTRLLEVICHMKLAHRRNDQDTKFFPGLLWMDPYNILEKKLEFLIRYTVNIHLVN